VASGRPDRRRILDRISGPEGNAMEIDPVCGMEVDPATAEWTHEFEGATYYFCSKGCRDDFAEDPTAYIG
jgi:YHS domain-containing protein